MIQTSVLSISKVNYTKPIFYTFFFQILRVHGVGYVVILDEACTSIQQLCSQNLNITLS